MELLEIDCKFAELSKSKGVIAAFTEYLAANSTLLPNNNLPVIGKNNIIQFLKAPGKYQMEWIPKQAKIAESGDMGYTWGNWTMTFGSVKESGKYLDIWIKENDMWKVLVDMTNIDPKK
jgi:ketosteroid isomerase-like protein